MCFDAGGVDGFGVQVESSVLIGETCTPSRSFHIERPASVKSGGVVYEVVLRLGVLVRL